MRGVSDERSEEARRNDRKQRRMIGNKDG